MKSLQKFLLVTTLLTGLQFGISGCETVGYVSSDVYYGPGYREPWFRDGDWMDGNRGYHEGNENHRGGGDVYINPPRVRIPAPPGIHIH